MFGLAKHLTGDDGDGTKTHVRLESLLKENVTRSMLKGKLALQHAAGLGVEPNVIPEGDVNFKDDARTVHVGWHPVAGAAGKWFAQQTRLGKLITKEIHGAPDPTQHWAVLVGGYAHELWMDEHLDVIYINEHLNPDEWHMYEVGHTTFNDAALRKAGEMVIYNMREARPAYNLITNNCQNFALNLLDAIQIGKHREFGSTYAIYERATGKGKIADLFDDGPAPVDNDPAMPKPQRQNTVQVAAQVMDENTTKIDAHDTLMK